MAKQFKDSYEYARVKSQRPDLSARVQRQEANTEFLLEGSEKYVPNTRNMSKVVREEVINGKRYMVISTNQSTKTLSGGIHFPLDNCATEGYNRTVVLKNKSNVFTEIMRYD